MAPSSPPAAPAPPTLRPPGSHFTRRGRAWAEVSHLGERRHRLRLGGPFLHGWLSGLCARLAEQSMSIEQAHAWVARDGTWVAELTFTSAAAAVEPAELPFLEFVESRAPEVTLRPRLDSVRLAHTDDYGGSLLLQIEAPDALGLLGAVLCAASRLGAFPSEMHIDTRAGRVDDRIWLADAVGRVPSAEVEQALRDWLASL